MMSLSIEARLAKVEALEQIRILKANYCDLCDSGYPADALCELFTDDAVWDGGELGVFIGCSSIHKFFTNMPNVMSFALHHVMNSAIEVSDDASSARARWYLLQTATMKKDNQAVWLAANYVDELSNVAGEWKFQRVTLRSRFYTTYEAGWAELPNLMEKS